MINGKYPLKVILDEQRGVGPNDIALNGKQVSISLMCLVHAGIHSCVVQNVHVSVIYTCNFDDTQ